MRKKALLTTLIAAASLLAVNPATAAPANDEEEERQFVRGDVEIKFFSGTKIIDEYSFIAQHRNNDTVSGNFKFEREFPEFPGLEIKFRGEVLCFTVAGNRARIGGQVTRTNFPEGIPVGTFLTWSVTNNDGKKEDGDEEEDTASMLLGADAMAYCLSGLPYSELKLQKGRIEVRP